MTVRKKRAPRVARGYTDGALSFKTKRMLDYHLYLKELKKDTVIRSFEVPQAGERQRNKYGATKIMIDDIVFDSMLESRYYIYLLIEKMNGRIQSFELQPEYELLPRFQKVIDGKKKTFRRTVYIADFLVIDNNNEASIIDVKGTLTEVFKLKRKLFEYTYPDLTLQVIGEKNGNWVKL